MSGQVARQEAEAECRLCLRVAALVNRNIAALFCTGLEPSVTAHYAWMCQFCWRRATQCIKFMERVRNSEGLLRNNMTDDKKIYEYTTVPVKALSICDSTECSNASYVNVYVHKEKRKENFFKNETKPCQIEHIILKEECEELGDITSIENPINDDETHEDDVRLSDIRKEIRGKRTRKITRKEDLLKLVENKCVKLIFTKVDQLREIEDKKKKSKYLSCLYKCDKCGLGMNELAMYEQHLTKHNESSGRFECEVCKYRFSCVKVFNKHKAAHARRWRCVKCSAVLTALDKCVAHVEQCSNSAQPCRCADCGKEFLSAYALKKHTSVVHDLEKRYKCDDCNKSYKYKHMLRKHMASHDGSRPFECDICGKKSINVSGHRAHMRQMHGPAGSKEETYCVECDIYFKNKYTLRWHFKSSPRHVSTDTFKHVCTECPKRFKLAHTLQLHIQTVHLQERTHVCTLCQKAYFTTSALTAHMKRVHPNRKRSKDHVCPVCGKGFYNKPTLKCHISAVHYKERPFACHVCPAAFGFEAALYTHKKLKHRMARDQCYTMSNKEINEMIRKEPVVEPIFKDEPTFETKIRKEIDVVAIIKEEPADDVLYKEELAVEAMIKEKPIIKSIIKKEPADEVMFKEEPIVESMVTEEPFVKTIKEEPADGAKINDKSAVEAPFKPAEQVQIKQELTDELLLEEELSEIAIKKQELIYDAMTTHDPTSKEMIQEEATVELIIKEEPTVKGKIEQIPAGDSSPDAACDSKHKIDIGPETLQLIYLNSEVKLKAGKEAPSKIICTSTENKEECGDFIGGEQMAKNSLKCLECHKVFTRADYLRLHTKLNHTVEDSTEHSEGRKEFSTLSSHRNDVITQKDEKPFVCSECHKGFTREFTLKMHYMVTHTGEKSFECSECNKVFTLRTNLTRHMMIHKGLKRKRCKRIT